MGKRYVVTEESGCGCGTLFVGALLISLFTAALPYLIPVVIIAIICWFVFGYPKMKENKRKAKEEAEILELERLNELERRRIEAERVQEELRSKKEKKNDWSDF
ncbi:hypothetical protein [Enterococcus sp. AZ177]|uniref:hypothetical protein n=1 Tax=unclassified Enterococcus TaxID=2608891 RepID=UPI003D2FBD74